MSAPRQRISARDYKNGGGRRGALDISKYQQFGYGLAAGLVVALGVFVFDHRTRPPETELTPQADSDKPVAAESVVSEAEDDSAEQYDFYDRLPNYQVLVTEVERDVKRDLASVPIDKPGAYVLQPASFKNQADAERMQQKLDKLGINADLQRVQIDEDVWHRVRIGPIRDLEKLNSMRRQLRAADLDDALLIRIGD